MTAVRAFDRICQLPLRPPLAPLCLRISLSPDATEPGLPTTTAEPGLCLLPVPACWSLALGAAPDLGVDGAG